MEHVHLAGYDYANVQRSPVTLADLNLLKASAGFTDRDREALRRAGDLLFAEAEALVDGWREIIGSQEHLSRWFQGLDGTPDEAYKAAVKPRFV